MNNKMTLVSNNNACTIWDEKSNIAQIKQIFAPKLTELEFKIFCEMGKATKLNPFLKEIWCVKYDERAPAQIFIGRDGYRKSAQAHPLYDYHLVESIYSNDDFKVINGAIHHEYTMLNRGQLLGAYCVVKRKGASFPTHVVVDIKEYSTGKSLWGASGKPSTMIKKVAEAQALRAAFQELFSGSYHETEEFIEDKIAKSPTGVNDHVNELINNKDIEEAVYEDAPLVTEPTKLTRPSEVDDGTLITSETLELVTSLIKEKKLDEARIAGMYNYLEVERLEEMTEFQGKKCVVFLDKIPAVVNG